MSNRIGRYEIRSRLGSGAFATVYEAFDPRLESLVAIKVLADNWIHEPDVRARFRQEAVLLRRVQTDHPAAPLLDVYDIDETEDGRPYFVMRLADRGSLADRSAPGRTWLAEAVLPVIDVLEQALATLHRAEIVHRDVKPSNLLIARASDKPGRALDSDEGVLIHVDERVLLGDLGLAKDLLITGSGLTVAGGTPRFMAPEQRDPAAAVDHRADLFAASAVVADLITGSPAVPTAASGLSEVARRHFATGMAVDPSQRHPDAAAWARAMRDAITESASVPPPPPSASAKVNYQRRPIGLLVVAATLAFGALGVLILLVTGNGSAIEGPSEANVGETFTLTADVESDDHYQWTVGGRTVSDSDLELTPDRAGFVIVDLVVTSFDGKTENSTKRIEVNE